MQRGKSIDPAEEVEDRVTENLVMLLPRRDGLTSPLTSASDEEELLECFQLWMATVIMLNSSESALMILLVMEEGVL